MHSRRLITSSVVFIDGQNDPISYPEPFIFLLRMLDEKTKGPWNVEHAQ